MWARRALRTVMVLGAVLTGVLVAQPAAHAEGDDYSKEASGVITLRTPSRAGVDPACTARAWIGKSHSGRIEATTSVTCRQANVSIFIDMWIKPSPNTLTSYAYDREVCKHTCRYGSTFAAIPATSGKRYCVHGSAERYNFVWYRGYRKDICITA